MKINKIPGILVILFPFIVYFSYIGFTSWYEWVQYDDLYKDGSINHSCKDKLEISAILFALIYCMLWLIIDSTLEKPFIGLPFVYLFKLFSKIFNFLSVLLAIIIAAVISFVAFCNKHLTINFNKNEK